MFFTDEAQEALPGALVDREVNILLLGESGVGKSTLINSFMNYLYYANLKDVLNNKLHVLIPARFHITDKNYEQVLVEVPKTIKDDELTDDVNETLLDAKAQTKDVKTYVFPIWLKDKTYRIRFIDTPGMGDERGIDQDKKNCELILSYLRQLKEIHAFCLLLKPTCSRLDVFLNYCITQILSRLERSAVDNVVFIFTNTRGQNFTAGETYTALRELIKNIKKDNGIDLPFSDQNMFYFDNEAFKFVASVKNGVKFQDFVYTATEGSWIKSSNEFLRLLMYFTQRHPHDLKKTISVNEALTLASHLAQPVTEIVQLIDDNIRKLAQHSKELSEAKLIKEDLKKKMYTPQIEMNVKKLEYPSTVCTHRNCIESYMVNGIRKTHYKQICCDGCWATFITPEIIGNAALYTCWAFRLDAYCKHCKHYLTTHVHIYYETEIFEKKMDETMMPEFTSQEELVTEKEKLIKSLQDRQEEFEEERRFILQSSATFDLFLKMHSVTPVGDIIKEYLKYQINREESYRASNNDETVISLKRLLDDYEKEKTMFRSQGGTDQSAHDYTPEEVQKIKNDLFNLKHVGLKIQELYGIHKSANIKDFKKRETVIGTFFKRFQGMAIAANKVYEVLMPK